MYNICRNFLVLLLSYKYIYSRTSRLYYPRNSIIRGFWDQNLVRPTYMKYITVKRLLSTPLLSAILWPKLSTPKLEEAKSSVNCPQARIDSLRSKVALAHLDIRDAINEDLLYHEQQAVSKVNENPKFFYSYA